MTTSSDKFTPGDGRKVTLCVGNSATVTVELHYPGTMSWLTVCVALEAAYRQAWAKSEEAYGGD